MVTTALPWSLLALLMLFVCQSVQYNSSSKRVRANGWGSPENRECFSIYTVSFLNEKKLYFVSQTRR